MMIKRTLLVAAVTMVTGAAYAFSPLLLALPNGSSKASFAASATPVVLPGRVFVKVAPGKDSAADKAIKAIGGKVVKSFPQIGWKSVTFPTSLAVASAVTKLTGNGSFAKVEPAYKRFFLETPNDPLVARQWSIPSLHLDDAWGLQHGDPGVTVCVIDSGFDTGHPDYAGVLLAGRNFGGGAEGDLTDIVGHGTHVAGTVGAATNNTIGIAGNAYGCRILPYKVATPDGGVSPDGLIAAIIAAGDATAPICSISIGGYGLDSVEQEAIRYSSSKGTLFIVSAANDNISQEAYPAAFEECVAVGATDRNDVKASFSNYGSWVDVAAPGVDVLSLYPRNLSATGYEYLSGTSMAAPNVSGVASLILSVGGAGSLTRSELRSILESTCDPITDPVLGTWVTKGRVNAFRAILATPAPVSETPLPTPPQIGEGTLSNGTSDSLTSIDGVSTVVQAVKKPGVGMSGSMSTSFSLSNLTLDQIRVGTLSMNFTADSRATVQIYLKDSSGRWNILSTQPGTGASKSLSIRMLGTALTNAFVGGSVNILVRTLIPTRLMTGRSPYTVIDQMQMRFTGVRATAKP